MVENLEPILMDWAEPTGEELLNAMYTEIGDGYVP